jgi:ribosome-associated translation inhibitor RaiA
LVLGRGELCHQRIDYAARRRAYRRRASVDAACFGTHGPTASAADAAEYRRVYCRTRLRRGEAAVSEAENQRRNVLDEVLRLGAGFKEGERAWVLDALSALVPHLARWDPDDLDVEISAKDRDGKEQHITLRVDLPGYSPLVAVVADRNLNRALAEAKHELIRQIEDHKSMREPKHNRHLRKKTT